jgi:hypothetical protein
MFFITACSATIKIKRSNVEHLQTKQTQAYLQNSVHFIDGGTRSARRKLPTCNNNNNNNNKTIVITSI